MSLLLVLRAVRHYWHTNLAVAFGVATAVAVLAGALLVGDSVRGTLRDLAESRIGNADVVVVSGNFFRQALSDDVRKDPRFAASFEDVVPLILAEAVVTAQGSGRRVGNVRVYGVDETFWRFHGQTGRTFSNAGEAWISHAVAEETGVADGEALLVRLAQPSDVPLESLHGRKDDPGRTIRATVRGVLPADALGEFSLRPEQGAIRTVFLPLERLQRDLGVTSRVNALLVANSPHGGGVDALMPLLRSRLSVRDAGLKLRTPGEGGVILVESDGGLIDAVREEAVTRTASLAGLEVEPILTYLANTIRVGAREIPYSLVAATTLPSSDGASRSPGTGLPPIVLNEWAARDLQAHAGDLTEIEYYVWEDPGRLVTRSAKFQIAGVVPIESRHRDLAPVYPGITDSPTLDEWDPPFPLDLRRVRRVDEDYWRNHRATPKAFIAIEDGQRLWSSRYGRVTSLRVGSAATGGPDEAVDLQRARFETSLARELDPVALGFAVRDVRLDAAQASRGATDFGQYFVYFSFFLVVSALVLAALFFKLGVEQRVREVGLLRAIGFDAAAIRRQFLIEAIVVAAAGSAAGVLGALAYGAAIIWALRTWWIDAVGTTALVLHVTPASLAIGAAGGLAAAVACTWLSLRGLRHISARALLAGSLTGDEPAGPSRDSRIRRALTVAVALAVLAALLVAGGMAGLVAPAAAFFGAGFALLGAGLFLASFLTRRQQGLAVGGRGFAALSRLGIRAATFRPARTVLAMAVIAAATFILIAVDAVRKDGPARGGLRSGLGGYALVVESLLPIAHDLDTPAGREAANIPAHDSVRFQPFRLRPGDDASCLNLYRPTNPRIVGATPEFVRQGRFAFRQTLAATGEERANPWLLLNRVFDDGAIPVIGDANSLAYVLHLAVGEDFVIPNGDRPITLRVVAALDDSLFQRELVMSESAFTKAFPEQAGYRVMLVDAPDELRAQVALEIEQGLSSFGADATSAADRLAGFHRVENTYLATFLTLGALGLVLGTFGLATVIMRNVLERRRELALLSAIGYRRRDFRVMLVTESLVLLGGGLLIGAIAATIATAPAMMERGGRAPISSTVILLLFAVSAAGLVAAMAGARAATRQPLLETLRSE